MPSPIPREPIGPATSIARLLAMLSLTLAGTAGAQLRLAPVDAATGAPTAARLQVDDRDGPWFLVPDPAHRAHHHPRLGGYVHADGVLEITPAKGPVRVRASRGLTSVPLDTTFLYLGPTTVELPLRDWVDPAALGWYGADPHVHGEHTSGAVYAPTSDAQAATAARAEGLDLLFLLDNRETRPGGAVRPPFPGVTLAHGEEYRADYWGHVVLLGLDELVLGQGYPGCCGAGQSAWPTLHEVLRGRPPSLALLAHPRSTHDERVPFRWPRTGVARELRALALQGSVHGMAVGSGSNEDSWAVPLYLDALRAGARWAATAEGDVALDRHDVAPPGAMRSYAHVPAGHSGEGDPALADRWQEAVARGASYATTGPVFTRLELDGHGPGSTVVAPGATRLGLAIGLRSLGRLDSLVVHGSTRSVWWRAWPGGRTAIDTTLWLPVEHDGFFVVEAHGPGDDWPGLVHPPRVVGSPIWFDVGRPVGPTPEVARRGVDELLELAEYVTRYRDFASPAESLATVTYLHEGAAAYEQLVDDPPPAPTLLAPSNGAQLASLRFPLQWEAPPSHDGEPISYLVLVGSTPNLLTPDQRFVVAGPPAIVEGFEPGESWYWNVVAFEPGEPPVPAANGPHQFRIADHAVAAPAAPGLLHCRAWTSQGTLRLRLGAPAAGDLRLDLYDARGRRVLSHEGGRLPAGEHELELPLRAGGNARLARGIYQLEARVGAARARAGVWLP